MPSVPQCVSKAYRSIKKKVFGNTDNTAEGIQSVEMGDARIGVAYFLGNIKMTRKPVRARNLLKTVLGNTVMGSDGAGDFTEAAGEVTGIDFGSAVKGVVKDVARGVAQSQLVQAGRGAAQRAVQSELVQAGKARLRSLGDRAGAMAEEFKRWLRTLCPKMAELVRSAYRGCVEEADFFADLSSFLSNELVDVVADGLAGVIDAFSFLNDALSGASSMMQGFWRGANQFLASRQVTLQGGHPALIANALARHAAAMVAGGLKDMALVGAKISGDLVSGSLASVVIGVFQRIIELVDRLFQYKRLSSVFSAGRELYQGRAEQGATVNHHEPFTEWFASAVSWTPVVAALVLNSGFAGHPLRFLKLYDSGAEDSPFLRSQYDRGVAYIEVLKDHARSYVREYTEAYGIKLSSDDRVVEARLKAVVNGEVLRQID